MRLRSCSLITIRETKLNEEILREIIDTLGFPASAEMPQILLVL